MSSDIIVQKFGGTSVADAVMRGHAIRRVMAARHAGLRPVVVVSAMGRSGDPYATDTLIAEARKVDPDIMPRELDLVMACGEIISTALMAAAIRAGSGIDTVALTGGQAGITTDAHFGSSRILSLDSACILDYTRQGKIPVVAGFQGVTDTEFGGLHGAITTLGRGGSDTTASAIGAAVDARGVEIYTDVDGVMTADPRVVPSARTLRSVTYHEVSEMAHLGARVLHPRAAEIAMDYAIPLWVKSTALGGQGSLITHEQELVPDTADATGVANTGPCSHVTLSILNDRDRDHVALEIFRLLATAGIPIYFVSSTDTTIAFVVDKSRLRDLRSALNAIVIPIRRPESALTRFYLLSAEDRGPTFAVQKRILSDAGPDFTTVIVPVTIGEDTRVVSLIGRRLQESVGVVARFVDCLLRAKIRPRQLADSKISLSCLVDEQDYERAARALHEEFIERSWATDTTEGGYSL